jgi:hypothetical protein
MFYPDPRQRRVGEGKQGEAVQVFAQFKDGELDAEGGG